MSASSRPSVLCVDDDRDIAEIVQAVLTDEGYQVSCLYSTEGDLLARTVGQLEPDCILLDSGSSTGYEVAWQEAAEMAARGRRVPVVMFTAHAQDVAEARAGTSARAAAAEFVAVLDKPFELDELIEAVAKATGESVPFDRSQAAEKQRTSELVAALRQRGATEIEPSKLREWAMFRDQRGALCQMYWWQARGVYQVGRYGADGKLRMIGQFVDRDAAINAALPG
ncbi:MAG TPA: response regulator [Candidatus Limnocylindria bacterium]|nr:response regulator [Candidatus Limnocylindria bacterium]